MFAALAKSGQNQCPMPFCEAALPGEWAKPEAMRAMRSIAMPMCISRNGDLRPGWVEWASDYYSSVDIYTRIQPPRDTRPHETRPLEKAPSGHTGAERQYHRGLSEDRSRFGDLRLLQHSAEPRQGFSDGKSLQLGQADPVRLCATVVTDWLIKKCSVGGSIQRNASWIHGSP